MKPAIVVLGALLAGGAGWAMHTFVYSDWTPPTPTRLRAGLRSGAPAAVVPVEPAAAQPGAGTAKPEPAKTPAKPEPQKPAAPPVRVRKITDVKLVVARNAKDLTLPRMREVHVDLEGTMSWHGEGDKVVDYNGYSHLGKDLRTAPDAFVIVATPETPWLQVRTMLLEAQNNLAWNAFLGVAKAGEPDILRILPIPQAKRPDEPLPEGKAFRVVMTSKDGPVELTVNDKKLATFPSDLAAEWNDWKKANPDLADTTNPDTTKVVLEPPKGAPIARVIEVIDVLRGIGIQSERIGGALPTRPRK